MDYTLEYFTAAAFDKWTCKKTKPSNHVAKYAKSRKAPEDVKCILSTNPYTHNTQTMGIIYDGFGGFELCSYGEYIEATKKLFFSIVQDIIYKEFGISCEKNGSYNYTYIAEKGRQFMLFISSLRDDIMRILNIDNDSRRQKNVFKPENYMGIELVYTGLFDSEQDWFNNNILLMADYDNDSYDGDKLSISYNDDGIYVCHDIPFAEPVNAVAALIWDKLNPELVSYTDIFGALPDYLSEVDSKNPYQFICDYANNLNTLYQSIEYGFHTYCMGRFVYNNGSNKNDISIFKEHIENLKKDCNDIKDALRAIKYLDNEMQYAIALGIQNLMEY